MITTFYIITSGIIFLILTTSIYYGYNLYKEEKKVLEFLNKSDSFSKMRVDTKKTVVTVIDTPTFKKDETFPIELSRFTISYSTKRTAPLTKLPNQSNKEELEYEY